MAVQAAILIVAALSAVEFGTQEARDEPTLLIFRILERLLRYVKTAFPDDEKVQSAALDVIEDKDALGELLVDSEIFFDSYIRLPAVAPLSKETSPILFYFESVITRGYNCVCQATVGATIGLELGDLPSKEEFKELMSFLASDGLENLVSALSWAFDSGVHFGISPDGTFPAVVHINVIESLRNKLVSGANDSSRTYTRLERLKQRLADEIALMADVTKEAKIANESIDEATSYDRPEAILAKGLNLALTPATRVIAAEQLCYMRNRIACRALRPDAAVSNFAEACRMAHFAFNVGGVARYTKYIAQNLLEIAAITQERPRRQLAEMIWVDAYAMPFVLGLTYSGNAPFSDLGWEKPVYASADLAIDYPSIPAYSLAPDFIYSGSIAEQLREIFPSFTPDLWSASVLLVQHFKDLSESYELPEPDRQLALYMPGDTAKERFPMREQHPIAWLYFLSDMLLQEHRTLRKPHAGLHGATAADYWYRRWLGAELRATFSNPSSDRFSPLRTPKFPHVAKYLLGPVGGGTPETRVPPTIWPRIAARWAA